MRFRLVFTSALMVLALAGPAAARGTLDSILPDIRAQHPGRLSDAEPWTDSDGRTHYRIKWLTPEGRILFFNADADSGRFSSSGDGDVGRQWRNRSRGDDDGASQSSGGDNNGGGHRSHWNGGDSGDGDTGGGGGDWRDRHDRGGDWRRDQSGGRHGDGGGHDWGGGRGGGGRGDWHGGGQGGDGGHHHHGN